MDIKICRKILAPFCYGPMIRAIGCSWPYNTEVDQEITYRSFLKISNEPRKQQWNLRATTSPSTNRNLPEKQQTEEPACLFFHTLSPIAPLKCFNLLRWNKAEQGTISAFIHLSFSTNLHETVLVCPHYLHTKVYQNTEANTANTKSYTYTDDTIYTVNLPYSEKRKIF